MSSISSPCGHVYNLELDITFPTSDTSTGIFSSTETIPYPIFLSGYPQGYNELIMPLLVQTDGTNKITATLDQMYIAKSPNLVLINNTGVTPESIVLKSNGKTLSPDRIASIPSNSVCFYLSNGSFRCDTYSFELTGTEKDIKTCNQKKNNLSFTATGETSGSNSENKYGLLTFIIAIVIFIFILGLTMLNIKMYFRG